jgi:hypothetical protein
MTDKTRPPKVRPLAWLVDKPGPHETHHVKTVLGKYAAWVSGGKAYVAVPHAFERRVVGTTIQEALAAAQADYEAMILGALDLGDAKS